MSLDSAFRELLVDVVRQVVREELGGAVPSPGLELMSYDQAAKAAGITRATVKKWVSTGRLRAIGSRRSRRVRREDLLSALEEGPPAPRGGHAQAILDSLKRGK